MKKGKIKQIIGPVIDVEFEDYQPKLYEALKAGNLTLETEQLLGNNIVRTIAMGSTDGLQRDVDVIATGSAISVPVGQEILGRMFDVLGAPIDELGEVKTEEVQPIHKPSPDLTELDTEAGVLETGIKVIDLIAPVPRGGKVAVFGGAGVGKTV